MDAIKRDDSWIVYALLAFYFVFTFVFLLEPYLMLISPILGFLAQLSVNTSSTAMSVFLGLICPSIVAFGFLALPFVFTKLTVDVFLKN